MEEDFRLPLGMEKMPPERRAMGYDGTRMSADDFSLSPHRPRPPSFAGDNPFEQERYNDVNMSDIPIQSSSSMAEQLLNDDEVPKEIRRNRWWIFHKDNTLTFLDEKRKASKLINFDITKIDILNSTPYYDYTFSKEMEFGILRNVFETKLDRALGFGKGANIKNERTMLQSQFTESRQINDNGSQSNIQHGFFKRLLGRR